MMSLIVVVLLVIAAHTHAVASPHTAAGPLNPDAQKKATQITDYFLHGAGKGQSWSRLSQFVDTIGPRISGSAALDNAVTYMTDAMVADRLDNVHSEAVTIPKWVCFGVKVSHRAGAWGRVCRDDIAT